MTDSQAPTSMPWWMAPVHVATFLFITLVSYTLLTVITVISMLAIVPLDAMGDADALVTALGAGGNAALALALHLTIAAAALGLGLVLPYRESAAVHLPTGLGEVATKIREALALRRGILAYLVPAGLGALTIGLAAGWLSERIMEMLPDYPNNLELISKLIAEGTGFGWGLLVVAVVFSAPVFEEIAFRGYLWSVFERVSSRNMMFFSFIALSAGALSGLLSWALGALSLPLGLAIGAWSLAWVTCLFASALRPEWSGWHSVAPLVLTSLLFMAYHQDPIHVLGLAPTAFFLGWLRLVSGSIWPPMLAHFTNNALAILLTLTLSESSMLDEVSWPMALGALSFTCMVCAITWAIVRSITPQQET